MSLRNIGIVYRKELTEALRDRRTLITTFLVPLLMIPVLGAGFAGVMSAVIGSAKKEKARVAIVGGEDSPGVVAALKRNAKLNVLAATADWRNQVVGKEIRAAVEIPPHFELDLGQGKAPTVTINVYGGELKSEMAAANVDSVLKEYRDSVATGQLVANHLSAELLKPFSVKRLNIAPPEKTAGAFLGGIIAYMLILMCLQGAMNPAIDLTAGEK